MIFVTLGNQDNKFDRLLRAIEKQINKGNIKEKVIVQAGFTKYESDVMEIHDYFSMDEFEQIMSECDLLITHGGVASINDGLKRGKKVIATPRLSKYGEHANDHQKQIIRKYTEKEFIIELKETSKLEEALEKAKDFKVKPYESNNQHFVELVSSYIEKENHTSWFNKYYEGISYLFFGGLTVVINISSFFIMDALGVNIYVNNVISWVVAVLFAFITNKLFVFQSKSTKKNVLLKEAGSFFFFRILSLGIDMLTIYLMIDLMSINKLISKVAANIFVVIVNYIFSKVFIFKKENK